MKKLASITILIVSLSLILVSCANVNFSEISDDNVTTSKKSDKTETAIESDDIKILMTENSWNDFSDSIASGELKINSSNSFKTAALNKALTISGYETSSLEYIEYTDSDWEFNVYWNDSSSETSSDSDIRHHLFYVADGVDAAAATYGYSVFDAKNNIYTKKINNGKISYVCLISNQVFMRIVISDNCVEFDDKVNQLINYALEI